MMKFLLVILPIAATAVASSLEQSAENPKLGVSTVHGCYASVGELQLSGPSTFNSQSSCSTSCQDAGAFVAATQSNLCYCGDKYPPVSTLVDDSQCDEPCPGFAFDACGGLGAFTVINTGLQVEVESSSGDSSSSETSATSSSIPSASSSASPSSVVTDFGTTTTASLQASTTTTAGSSSNSTSSGTPATSGSTLPSVSVVGNSSAASLSLSRLNMAILGLGFAFLV